MRRPQFMPYLLSSNQGRQLIGYRFDVECAGPTVDKSLYRSLTWKKATGKRKLALSPVVNTPCHQAERHPCQKHPSESAFDQLWWRKETRGAMPILQFDIVGKGSDDQHSTAKTEHALQSQMLRKG